MLTKLEFNNLKLTQYCDNECCTTYNQVGLDNIKTQSRAKGQVYCNRCQNRWVLTKGTMLFGLRTPINKVVQVLLLLVRGMGLRNTCRQESVTADSVLFWLEKAATHVNDFTNYLQKDMHLEQVQIDEFWSFVLKKEKYYSRRESTGGGR